MDITMEKAKPAYIFIDTETGGLDESECDLLEIGFIVTDESGNILDEYSYLIEYEDPRVTIEALSINGYLSRKEGWEPSAVAKTFFEVLNSIKLQNNNLILVGNNIQFDIDFINMFLSNYLPHSPKGKWSELFFRRIIDIKHVVNFLKPLGYFPKSEFSGDSLAQLANGFKVEKGRAHWAVGDALTTKNVFFALRKLIPYSRSV